jgi:putative ABC transport system permease protein
VLALAGGLGGLIVARAGTDLLARFVTVPAATAGLVTDTLDWPVLGFALLLALVTGVACGLAPVFQVSRTDLNDVLRQHGQGRTTFRHDWTRTSLVVSEVALSFVLLFGASLLLQSLMKLRDQPLGFQPDHALTLRVSLDFQRAWAPFYETALQRLDALPGVTAVGATYALPLKGASWVSGFTIEGHPAPAPGQRPNANYRVVSGGYFKAMGIPLQRGRVFTDRDREGTPRVAIVNEAFANRYFAGEDPIGQRLRIDTGRGVPREVVGIVGNVKHAELDVASAPEMYEPYLQKPMPMMSLVIRTQRDPALLIGPAQEALASVDRNQPISEVMTLDNLVASAVSQPQSRTVLVGAFGLCALVLTAIGLYGVMAYMVGQQIREIGVRMAFGATRATILEAVLGQGLRLAVMGVVLGALLTLWAARTLRTLLFEVNVLDPWSYLFVTVLLLAVSLLALWVPARRATTIDPLVALRYE